MSWTQAHPGGLGTQRVGLARTVAALLVAALCLTLLAGTPRAASMPDVGVIVRTAPGAIAEAERAVARVGGQIGRHLGIIGGFEAKVPAGAVPYIGSTPGVLQVVPDGRMRAMAIDPVTGYDANVDMGAMPNVNAIIKADGAFGQGITGRGVDVALIDTGISPVEGLNSAGKVINGADLSFDSQADNLRYLDGFGHGTHMAGIIAGRDAGVTAGTESAPAGFVGVAPDARILNVKVGASDGATDVSQVIAAIDWVVQHRNDNGMNVRVLNLSFGTDSTQSYLYDPLAFAVEVAWRKGIVVVVASGNDGKTSSTLAMPALDPLVLAISASDSMGTLTRTDDQVASFSNQGTGTRRADLVAPGKSVISLRDAGSYADVYYAGGRVGERFFKGSGTSQAAAVVSGAAALLLQQRPNLTPDQVKSILKSSAFRLASTSNIAQGSGLIDVTKALATPTPNTTQAATGATGTGLLEKSRGSLHVYDNGVPLVGEMDIMGSSWSGSSWSGSSWSGSSWSGGMWNGSSWSGSSWSGSSWSGSSWSGSSWSGSSWSGSSWSSHIWSEASWSGSSWSGSSWSGSSWSGSSWSGSSWSGSSWSGSSWSSSGWASDAWGSGADAGTQDGGWLGSTWG